MKVIRRILPYIILFLITLFILEPILFHGKTIVGADSLFHFSNIYSWQNKILNGNLLTFKLLPIIGNGFLYGVTIFYGFLSHFLTSILSIIIYKMGFDFSIIKAMKIYYFLVFFLSSIITYKFSLAVSKDKVVSLVSSIFYLVLPFKLWDLYIRDGYTEIFTFLFIPMVFYGIYLLLNDDKKYWIYLIIGTVGLILSHFVTTLVVAFAVSIYLIVNYKKIKIKKFILPIFLIIGLVAFYIFPFVEHYYGNYWIFDNNVDNTEMFINSIISIKELIIPNIIPGDHQFFIPITLLITLIVSLFNYKKLNDDNIFKSFIIIIIIFFIMITVPPIISLLSSKLSIIQYLFRLYSIPLFCLCIISPMCLKLINKDIVKKSIALLLIALTTLISYLTIDKVYLCDYNMYNSDISNNGMGWQKEYLTVNAHNNYDYILNRNNDIIVTDGNATVNNLKSTFGSLEFDVVGDEYSLELPFYYYLGYEVYNGESKEKLNLIENNHGLVEIQGIGNRHLVVKYEGTILMKISYIISLISLVIYILILVRKVIFGGK